MGAAVLIGADGQVLDGLAVPNGAGRGEAKMGKIFPLLLRVYIKIPISPSVWSYRGRQIRQFARESWSMGRCVRLYLYVFDLP